MCSPFSQSYRRDKFVNGVLTSTGCFDRHELSRWEQEDIKGLYAITHGYYYYNKVDYDDMSEIASMKLGRGL